MRTLSNKEQTPKIDKTVPMPGRRGPGRNFQAEKPKDGKKTLKRLIAYFNEEKLRVISLLSVVFILVVCSVLAPGAQAKAIDLITVGDFHLLPKVILVMSVLYIITCICSLFQGLISSKMSQSIVKRLREDLFDKIINLPIGYLDNHSHGDIMSRMTNDVENISNTISQSMSSLFSGVMTIIGTVIMMVYYCPSLALLSCTTVIMTVFATKYLSKVMKKFYSRRQKLLGELNSCVEETVTGYKTVAAYNHQDEMHDKFSSVSDNLTKAGIIADIFGGSMGPVMNFINNVGFVIIAAFGGYFAINGIISVGIIAAFIVYAKQFGRPIDEIAQVYGQIQSAMAGAERVFQLMDEESENKCGSGNLDNAEGVITFKNVDFSYHEGKQVLYDFNLQVKAGQKVALVGATGSGKTTVVNLLMRFYDVDSGEILIDGVNIKDIDIEDLRRNTAIVLQDTVLFSDTVGNNLKYANPDATDEELTKAAEMSNCTSLIRKLKKGYETMLSESGSNLSQGQRQLLSIGRAFLANPKILILDEATSSVDTRTEKKIQDAMTTLMKSRTSLIIAHRLSTIRDADVIVVMDKGRIAEMGNHEELLDKKGIYYDLYMTQFAGNAI